MGIKYTTRNVFRSVMIGLFVTVIVAVITGLIVNQRFASIQLDKQKLAIAPSPTRIYDANGNIIAEFEKDNKEMTPYSQIPSAVIEGVVSTEDRDFFNHSGINVRAIFRSVLVDLHSGSYQEGGSTITQQLVKTVYLDPGKTLDRKIQEAVYATAIEKQYSKQDIISLYLDHIFYGEQAYGVKNAISTYFGQTLDEFEKQDRIDLIAKSALLAGLPNAPSQLDPYYHPQAAMQRRNTVLTNMYVEGYITKDEYESAKAKDFLILSKPNINNNIQVHYPEYVSYVLSEASSKLNMPLQEVMYSGAQIFTSFEPDVYNAIRQHMADSSLYPSNMGGDGRKVEGAAVFLNPQNGEIYALTGSREQITQFLAFNRAYQAKRQPGSAFKPIIDYGPALEKGVLSPYSSIPCGQTISGYHVKDDTPCGGSLTMTEALRISENSPAVWTLNHVGISYARSFAEKLGITLDSTDIYLPMAIGGIKYGVTPLEMADAYQVYADGGKRAEAHTIRKIVNNIGETIYQPELPKQIIKESTASEMKKMLRGVVTSGTGKNANVPGYNIAGKTGTNENPDGHGNKDIWFIGFTSNMVGAVWMGYDNTDSSHYIPSGETSYIAAKMFSRIAKDVLPLLPQADNGNNNASDNTPVDKINLNLYKNAEGSQIILKWDTAPGIKYEVLRNGTLIDDSSNGSYTDTNVQPEQTYTYVVQGYDQSTGEKVLESDKTSIQLPKIETVQAPDSSQTSKTTTDQQTQQTAQQTGQTSQQQQQSTGSQENTSSTQQQTNTNQQTQGNGTTTNQTNSTNTTVTAKTKSANTESNSGTNQNTSLSGTK